MELTETDPCILVADDDRLIRVTLSKGLRDAGYVVLEAEDGRQAADIGLEHKPALAILDLRMPVMSGIDAARELRDSAGVPFLFLSAYNDKEVVRQAAEEGALGYLVKPIEVGQILPTIEAALERAGEIRRLKRTKDGLTQALGQRREISVAIGILAERHHTTADAAFEALRSYARSNRRKLADVATELVENVDNVNEMLSNIMGRTPPTR